MLLALLKSPLTGTAATLAGLGLLALPLHHLTSATPTPTPGNPTAAAGPTAHALLRLKLLTPARHITLKTESGALLGDLTDIPAGESEHDADLPLTGGRAELVLDADFGTATADTAVFLTIMPDGREDQTAYALGNQCFQAPLRYTWPAP